MSKLISGKEISNEINQAVKDKIAALTGEKGFPPKLFSFTNRESQDAKIYANMQKRIAEFVGIEFVSKEIAPNVTEKELLLEIEKANIDNTVTAIIIQKPLPEGINHDSIVAKIKPEKDAEGIHPYNLGKIFRRDADIVPCTPGAIMKILDFHNIDLYGKEVVIVGHSDIVGKPLSVMMLNENATISVCHIETSKKGNLKEYTQKAEILVVAVGKAELITKEHVSEGAIVIDVGINKVEGKIVGDVKFDEVEQKARFITPVPGGVGPVTVSILMRNVLRAYKRQELDKR